VATQRRGFRASVFEGVARAAGARSPEFRTLAAGALPRQGSPKGRPTGAVGSPEGRTAPALWGLPGLRAGCRAQRISHNAKGGKDGAACQRIIHNADGGTTEIPKRAAHQIRLMIFSPNSPSGRTRRMVSASMYGNQPSIPPPTKGPI